MQVVYELGGGREEALRRDYMHFYYRVKRLEDSVIGYFLTGDAHAFIRARFPREGVPVFSKAAFDGAAAERFERRVERLLCGRGYRRAAANMPLPDFPVRLEVDFCGIRETFGYVFGGDDALNAFCAAVCKRAAELFRHRFSAPPRTVCAARSAGADGAESGGVPLFSTGAEGDL